eukprot:scaffold65954_cov47-Prasinocladus_malaysianus.AAC.9
MVCRKRPRVVLDTLMTSLSLLPQVDLLPCRMALGLTTSDVPPAFIGEVHSVGSWSKRSSLTALSAEILAPTPGRTAVNAEFPRPSESLEAGDDGFGHVFQRFGLRSSSTEGDRFRVSAWASLELDKVPGGGDQAVDVVSLEDSAWLWVTFRDAGGLNKEESV